MVKLRSDEVIIEGKVRRQTSQKEMIRLINNYMNKVAKEIDQEPQFTVSSYGDRIRLSTDGYFYQQFFDPSQSELPQLTRDAKAEFGGEWEIPTGYEDQEKFTAWLEKHGWSLEPESSGIITIYRMN